MPYRYQFLAEDFDTQRDINEIDIACEHINLSLQDNQIPYARFIKDLKTRLEYSIINNIPISEEDYQDYLNLSGSQQTINEEELLKLVNTEVKSQDMEGQVFIRTRNEN
jgi:hypothetical protein